MKMKVAQYIADFFVSKQVKHVFTVTGGGAMHLNDALGHKEELKCIYNHHEQACAIAAEGYARLTGKIAVVCVTSGPGGTNALTGVLGGWQDSIPMFIVSGQVKSETTTWSTDVPLRQLGDQEFQIVDCVKGMTKYARMVTEPEKIRYDLEKAWYLAMHGRKGPVWLDIPLDVQAAVIETEELEGYDERAKAKEEPVYDERLTEQVFGKIRKAKRPVILAGTGIRLGEAYEEFRNLIDRMGIPVLTAWNAHDLLEETHPLYCGRPGSVGTRGGNFVVQSSDLLIVLGCRMNIRQISYNYRDFAKGAYKIVVDIDEAELQKPTVHVDLPIWADVKDVLRCWLREMEHSELEECNFSRWLAWCRKMNEKYPAVLAEYYNRKSPVNPYVFIKELSGKINEDDRIICGNGSACVITFQALEIKKGQRMFTNSGCAAMGYGFPAAIGACFAEEKNRIICLDGDGSFQMNLQELQTVKHHNLNLKIVILNNNGYHSIRQTQMNMFEPPLVGVSSDSGISFPSFEGLARAYEIPYMKIASLDGIAVQITKMLEMEGPVLCEVVCDPKQNFEPKLSSKVLPDGRIVSPEIDDMYPFLPREEYEANKRDGMID